MGFFKIFGSKDLLETAKIIQKNFPENLIAESLKESDPLKNGFRTLLDNIKNEIDETKNNHMKMQILLEYVQTYFSYLSKDESITLSDFVNEIIASMLKKASINEILSLIILPKDILYNLLKSSEFEFGEFGSHNYIFHRMRYLFELSRDKIEMADNDYAKLLILIYFDKHGVGGNPYLKEMLYREIKIQFIKGEVPIIKTLMEHNYVRMLSKAERIEIIDQIQLDGLREHLSTELNSGNKSFVLFELLYFFSKYNVQTAKTMLNKELGDNIARFNGKTLKQLIKNKYFSYMDPERLNAFSPNINFEQIFTELNFIQGVQLLERLSKMGYTNAREIIKIQALKLALNNNVNTATKTFKKYVTDEQLVDFLKSNES